MSPSKVCPEVDVAVLGAGPTGLGAAWRLEELRRAGGGWTWHLFEAGAASGGLASSVVDQAGFRWDLGGHVIYSHYAYFDAVLQQVLAPDEWLHHVRERWIHLCGRWVPYPVQRNLQRLPQDELDRCIRGLVHARERVAREPAPAHFAAWARAQFGDALYELFFAPFNRKMWATEPEQMSVEWAGGHSGSQHANVPTVDLARILENVRSGSDDRGWDANARFPYPRQGGTGAIWKRVAATLPSERVSWRTPVESIDPVQRVLHLADGSAVRYGAIVSGIALDALLQQLRGRADLVGRASALRHTCVHAVGLGFSGAMPADLEGKCWLYFAEPALPFYRGTLLSTYSPENVPEPGRQWSILLEVATSRERPLDAAGLVAQCEQALRSTGVVPADARTLTRWHRFLPRGYPVPTINRDTVLDEIDAALRASRIWSRGRFGGWKYEVSNQDHSFQQGVEAVDAALLGARETTWPDPDAANAGRAPWPASAAQVNA